MMSSFVTIVFYLFAMVLKNMLKGNRDECGESNHVAFPTENNSNPKASSPPTRCVTFTLFFDRLQFNKELPASSCGHSLSTTKATARSSSSILRKNPRYSKTKTPTDNAIVRRDAYGLLLIETLEEVLPAAQLHAMIGYGFDDWKTRHVYTNKKGLSTKQAALYRQSQKIAVNDDEFLRMLHDELTTLVQRQELGPLLSVSAASSCAVPALAGTKKSKKNKKRSRLDVVDEDNYVVNPQRIKRRRTNSSNALQSP